jgi:hypothetical protein
VFVEERLARPFSNGRANRRGADREGHVAVRRTIRPTPAVELTASVSTSVR